MQFGGRTLTVFNAKKKNKQTSKLNKQSENTSTMLHGFALFICGGPCHLSSVKQCSGDHILF